MFTLKSHNSIAVFARRYSDKHLNTLLRSVFFFKSVDGRNEIRAVQAAITLLLLQVIDFFQNNYRYVS